MSLPSRMCSFRCARAANSWSCVTMTIVMPSSALMRASRSMICRADLRVQVAGRLVGQQQLRLAGQRARDRHALLLPARELAGQVPHARGQPQLGQRLLDALLALGGRHAAVAQRHVDVVEHVQVGDQVEALEDEADLLVAQPRQALVGQPAHVLAVQPVLALVEVVQQARHRQERRLARARRPHDGHELAALDRHASRPPAPRSRPAPRGTPCARRACISSMGEAQRRFGRDGSGDGVIVIGTASYSTSKRHV